MLLRNCLLREENRNDELLHIYDVFNKLKIFELFVNILVKLMAGEENPRERLPSEETAKDGESAWLDAHYDPVASLNTLTSCMVLEDLNCDGEYKVNCV